MAAIELRNVTKKFATADGGTYTALEDLSLTVEEGQFCAVVGPTGCGKSTTLTLVSGLELVSSGEAVVHGQPVRGDRHEHRLRLPAGRRLPVEVGAGQRRGRPAVPRHQEGRGERAGPGLAASGRPVRLRRPLPPPAVGRHAQARGAGPDADQPAPHPADGRTVQRARRADPGDHVDRAAPAVGPDQAGRRLRHPRPRGGHRPRRQGRRHHRRSRAPSRPSSRSTCPARASCRRSASTRPSPGSTSRSGKRCATRSTRPTPARPPCRRWRHERRPPAHRSARGRAGPPRSAHRRCFRSAAAATESAQHPQAGAPGEQPGWRSSSSS